MNGQTRSRDADRPTSLPSHIDEVCRQFEAAWRAGQRPRIEDALRDAPESARSALCAELVGIELAYRVLAGERPERGEYHSRLSHYGNLIDRVFDEGTSVPTTRLPNGKHSSTAAIPDSVAATQGRPDAEKSSDPYDTLAEKRGPVERDRFPIVPGYEILSVLGRGGMGVVYRARQTKLNRLVALKMILAGSHARREELARFRGEAEAVALLQHPNIVQIYEVGEADGLPYLSLEYVDGGSLAKHAAKASLSPRAAAEMVQTLARAMHAAHQRGIVHRDLKPANVLLSGSGIPKITDFGLAKRLDAEAGQTHSGDIMGTPSYMAPEQAAGKVRMIGPAADIYALGAILYELLTDQPPFKAETPVATIYRVVTDEPVPPSKLGKKLPRDLETVCLKCLEKDIGKRYPSADALAEDLRRFLNDEPIQARPTTTGERLRKWVRRKPAAAGLVAATLLLVVAAFTASVFYALYYKQQLASVKAQEETRQRSRQNLLRAEELQAAGRWQDADTELQKAREVLSAQSGPAADELRNEVEQRLAVVRERLQEEKNRRLARQRLEAFQKPYDDALFYQTLFTGLDVPDSRAQTLSAVETALGSYAMDRETSAGGGFVDRLEKDRPYQSAQEHQRLASACYELLLIRADIEASAPAGSTESEAQSRQRADRALQLLAQAGLLGERYGLRTRTYQLRKARYSSRSKNAQASNDSREPLPATPTGALDWFIEGLDRYRSDKFDEAQRACNEVLRVQPDHFWARYVLALCELRTGRWAEARAELTVCASRRAEFVWPRLLRGFAASELGHQYESAADGDGKGRAATVNRAAEEDLDWSLKKSQDPLVQYVGLANLGVLHIRRHQWQDAVAELNMAIKVNPVRFQAYANLAQAYQEMGQLEDAVHALDQAIQRAPALPLLYETRADVHLKRRHRLAARNDLEKAVELASKRPTTERLVKALVALGQLLHQEGDYRGALARYDRALALDPNSGRVCRLRAETLLALKRPERAAEDLDRYLAGARQPDPAVYTARGLLYADKGAYARAIEMYTLALRAQPRDVEARCARGWTYVLLDSPRLALDDFDACLRIDANHADARAGRGNARVRLKQLDGALDDAAAAAKLGPLTDRLAYNIARIYAQAAGHMDSQARALGGSGYPELAQRRARYQEKALHYLRQCLELVPRDGRSTFWRQQVETDPVWTAVRHGSEYLELFVRYSGSGT
jgi:eukaryotic-like serine/threonine-protein kinase